MLNMKLFINVTQRSAFMAGTNKGKNNMKISKRMLKRLIREELNHVLHEDTFMSDDPEDMAFRGDDVAAAPGAPGQSRAGSRESMQAVHQTDIFEDLVNELNRIQIDVERLEDTGGRPGEAENIWTEANEAWQSFTRQWSAVASAGGR